MSSGTSVKTLIKGRNVLYQPIKVSKLHPDAELISKETENDAGWDLTIVSRCDSRAEDVSQDVNTFSTGLVIKPPPHYHLEVIPHPSLYKTGYMLAGSPIIINPHNEEELILPLFKYREAEDLELPFKAALVVLRLTEYAVVAHDAVPTIRRQRATRMEEEEIEFVSAPKKNAKGRQTKTNHMF